MFAQDVSILFEDESLILHLQRSSWLDQYSFYGNMDVHQIEVQSSFRAWTAMTPQIHQIKIYSGIQENSGFPVLWRPKSRSELMHELKESLKSAWNLEPWECGVNIEGKRHEDGVEGIKVA